MLSNKTILILTHYYAYGPAEDLTWFFTLIEPIEKLIVIKIPLYMTKDEAVHMHVYEYGTKTYETSYKLNLPTRFNFNMYLDIILKLFIYLFSLLKIKFSINNIDIAIAEDPLTALLAIRLKSKGFVNKVIFHSHSFDPNRLKNTFLKKLYLFLDYYVTRSCDAVWVLSKRLRDIRQRMGAKKVILVPICIRDDIITKCANINKDKGNEAVYVGVLNKDKGVDILARTIPHIIDLFEKIHIIGKGPLKSLYEKLSLVYKGRVIFHGPKPFEYSVEIIARSTLGFTLSRPSMEILTTDPMKPKVYIVCGTPTVIPKYFEISSAIRKYHAGLVIDYPLPSRIINAVREFTNKKDFYIEGAKNMAQTFKWWICSQVLREAIYKTAKVLEF